MVRDKVGPVAAFKIAIIVKRLPKTRSGKILRGTVRKIADNEPYKMPATIDDPAILDEIKQDLKDNNILKFNGCPNAFETIFPSDITTYSVDNCCNRKTCYFYNY